MPLEEGAATVRFRMTAIRPISWVDFWLALFAVGLASVLGLGFGQSLSNDLVQATYRVRALGTEDVLRGEDQLEVPVRFAQVETLNRAIDTLAGRFRVFAHAQERAIEARDAARKLRSLLFASVSHDLKSPLNSISGFAELVRQNRSGPTTREPRLHRTERARALGSHRDHFGHGQGRGRSHGALPQHRGPRQRRGRGATPRATFGGSTTGTVRGRGRRRLALHSGGRGALGAGHRSAHLVFGAVRAKRWCDLGRRPPAGRSQSKPDRGGGDVSKWWRPTARCAPKS